MNSDPKSRSCRTPSAVIHQIVPWGWTPERSEIDNAKPEGNSKIKRLLFWWDKTASISVKNKCSLCRWWMEAWSARRGSKLLRKGCCDRPLRPAEATPTPTIQTLTSWAMKSCSSSKTETAKFQKDWSKKWSTQSRKPSGRTEMTPATRPALSALRILRSVKWWRGCPLARTSTTRPASTSGSRAKNDAQFATRKSSDRTFMSLNKLPECEYNCSYDKKDESKSYKDE